MLAGGVLAVALVLALIGSTAALIGVGVAVGVVALAGTALARQAWRYRVVAGPALVFLTIPFVLVYLSAQNPYERTSFALLRDDITGVGAATIAVAAAILVFSGVREIAIARRSAAGAPWRSFVLSGAFGGGGTQSAPTTGIAMVATGPAILLVAILLVVPTLVDGQQQQAGAGAILGGIVLAIVGVIVAPALAAVALVGRGDRAERERAVQRQAVAAHLHDSVLQTFALVQRNIDDPDEVRRLIRRQERELRDWLAGREPTRPDTLVGALTQVIDEVEAEHHVTIELDVVGDRPADTRVLPVVDAAREALRNAGRHADGAPIRVVADTAEDAVTVYVRDEGPGFDREAVPPTRRGICDAIIARMEAAGGTAVIDTVPGAGTEVILRLPSARPRA